MLGKAQQLFDSALASGLSGLSSIIPLLPAATQLSLYIAFPHCHGHPPSLIPPSPVPIPLPSFGIMMAGLCVTVLTNGMPTARCGDYGIAPTCGGFGPVFQVKTGSSSVFIGGKRAARGGVVFDFAKACSGKDSAKNPAPTSRGGALASAVKSVAKDAVSFKTKAGKLNKGKVLGAAGTVLGVAAAATDAAQAGSQAEFEAQSVAMKQDALQMASDIAGEVAGAMMELDKGVPPVLPSPGVLMPGTATVLIGGVPLPAFSVASMYTKYKTNQENERIRRANSRRAAVAQAQRCS